MIIIVAHRTLFGLVAGEPNGLFSPEIIITNQPRICLVRPMFGNILIATDGSKHSEHAANMGIELAKLSKGRVTAIFIADMGRYFVPISDAGFSISSEAMDSIRSSILKSGETAVQRIEEMAKAAGVAAEGKVIEGRPANDLMKFAEDAGMDVIVIGSIGKTGLEKFLLGSVAEKVVRNSKVPVLIVHGE
jgi:nucleotide-binding universal stress UspA family protein